MAKTEVNFPYESPDELLAEGTLKGNPCSVPSSSRLEAEVVSTSTSSSSGETSSRSSDGLSRSSSSEGVSTSSSPHEGPTTLGRSVLKKKDPAQVGLVPEIVVEVTEFPGAPACSNPQDGPNSYFPNPKVVPTLKSTTLNKKYLLPSGYTFVIPEADATVNEPPTKCIVVY